MNSYRYLCCPQIVCLTACVMLVSADTSAANDEQEIEYLLAGMLQERGKLQSGSCAIEGRDQTSGPFTMKYLMKGDSFRFTRTQKTTPPLTQHVCDNRQQLVLWDGAAECNIYKSAQAERKGVGTWDPRLAGLHVL